MKKFFFLVCAILCAYSSFATCITAKQVSTNYKDTTVTFTLAWSESACTGTTHWRNDAWCFVDFRPYNTDGSKGTWTRAVISPITVINGAFTAGTGSNNEFYITRTAEGQPATVTVKLSNVPTNKFDWCAFASDSENKVDGKTGVSRCNNSTIALGSVGFTSPQTWVVGSQTWSAPVTATFCNKSDYNGGNSTAMNADCRDNPGRQSQFFSWCMVVQYAETLCPSPWRVPNAQDFRNLDIGVNGGTGATRQDCASISRLVDPAVWGGSKDGICTALGDMHLVGDFMMYLGLDPSTGGNQASDCRHGFYLNIVSSTCWMYVAMGYGMSCGYGVPVRCVKN